MIGEAGGDETGVAVFQKASLAAIPHRLVNLSQVRTVAAQGSMKVEGKGREDADPGEGEEQQ